MKIIGKLLLWLAIAALLVILALYLLMQTRWGARQISRTVSENSGYHLAFEVMEHHFSSPSIFVLKNVTFGREGQPATLTAGSVGIGLSVRQLTDPLHVGMLMIDNGTLRLPSSDAPLPLAADVLRLSDMTVEETDNARYLSARRVSGVISPWQPATGNVLGHQAQIQLNADTFNIGDIPLKNVLIRGALNNGITTLTALSADIARGTVSGSATRDANGNWQIESLNLNDIRLQSGLSLKDFLAPLTDASSLAIGRLSITHASLQGPDWAATDLDLSLRNLTLSRDGWQSDNGRLAMSASDVIYGSLHLIAPVVNAEFSPQGVNLRQFTSRWEGGTVRTSGSWVRSSSALTLDDLSIEGLEYTLPDNWRSLWLEPLPNWLQHVALKKFSTNRNLIIDIDPNFPWQITSFAGHGENLQLASGGKWGLWSGQLTMLGAAATFNRVDLYQPEVSLSANGSTINISALNARTEKGMLEATAIISQLPQRQTTLSLNGRGVPLDILQPWGWPALPISGDGNLQLQAHGSLQSDITLKPTVSGQLNAINARGEKIIQTMQAGVVDTAPQ